MVLTAMISLDSDGRQAIGGDVWMRHPHCRSRGPDIGHSVLIRSAAAAMVHFPGPITGCDCDCNMQLELGAAVQ